MKTEVLSWRISSGLKSQLAREARLRRTTVTALLDEAARSYLATSADGVDDATRQAQLRKAALECIGTIDLPDTNASVNVSRIVRARILGRRGR